MPTRKLINDYTFYKIVNINGDIELCYVGSTANFNERLRSHRHACNNENSRHYTNKLYTTIREHGGWCEFKMVPIGTAKQLSFMEARIIEEGYRIKLKAELNTQKCFTTDKEKKEYYEKNKEWYKEYYEKNKEWYKEYYENNKEKIAEYYENNKEKIAAQQKEYCENNKAKCTAKSKKYYENNKAKCIAKSKKYYENNKEKRAEYNENNKEKIAEKSKEKITCECGCIVNTCVLPRHKRTPKHIKIMEELATKNKIEIEK